MIPLSNQQKAQIAQAARRAYDAWPAREGFEDCNPTLTKTACFEAWRRVEQGKAVGVQSLRLCTSEQHYLRLLAHFENLANEGSAALKLLLRHAEEARITAFFKLRQALAERGLDEGYAAAICQRQYKRPLGEASAKQLWNLMYTVRNRRKALPKAQRAKAPRKVREKAGVLSAPAAGPSESDLQHRMSLAIRDENYEEAARLRDVIAATADQENPF